jgi:hypothetical protein
MVRHVMNARNRTQADVAAWAGLTPSALSGVLALKRSFGIRCAHYAGPG